MPIQMGTGSFNSNIETSRHAYYICTCIHTLNTEKFGKFFMHGVSCTVVGQPSFVLHHGLCVSVVMRDLPALHPRAVKSRVKLFVGKIFAVLVQLGTLQYPSSLKDDK